MTDTQAKQALHDAMRIAPSMRLAFETHPEKSIRDTVWRIFEGYMVEVLDAGQLVNMEATFAAQVDYLKKCYPSFKPPNVQKKALAEVQKMEAYERLQLLLPAYAHTLEVAEEVLEAVGYQERWMFRP